MLKSSSRKKEVVFVSVHFAQCTGIMRSNGNNWNGFRGTRRISKKVVTRRNLQLQVNTR